MNVSGRHYYRFIYLKSEEWATLRTAKLAAVDAVCARCKKRDICNDVHHLNYRNLHDVQLSDLLVLCRPCHELIHEYLDAMRDGKLEKKGKPRAWLSFLEMWGPRPDLTPELRHMIVSMRRKGMMEDTTPRKKPILKAVEPVKKKAKNKTDLVEIATMIGRVRYSKIKELVRAKGCTLEEFVFDAVCKQQAKMQAEAERARVRKFMEGLPNLSYRNGLTSGTN